MTDTTLAELHELALRLAPELQPAPLYVLEEFDTFPLSVLACAAGGTMNVVVREHLERLGVYRGPGPAIMLSSRVCREFEREWLLSVFLHELAHCLPAATVQPDLPTDREQSLEDAASMLDPLPAMVGVPRWCPDHDRDFHRIALHLWWRAALAGEFASLDLLGGGRALDLPPAFMLWNGLGAEPTRMLDLTFSEIIAQPEPAKFRGLWRESLAYFMANNPEPEILKEAC